MLKVLRPVRPAFGNLGLYGSANALKISGVAATAKLQTGLSLRAAYSTGSPNSSGSPKAVADSLIAKLPGNTPLSKSGLLATGIGAASYVIGNSLYVVNAETCLFGVFTVLMYIASRTVAPLYKDWAEGHINHISKTLNDARADHVEAVKTRVDEVKKQSIVVPVTKSLFALSKETIQLESEAFKRAQEVEIAAKAKEVLDSWVRYEASVRQREQADLAKSVIAEVEQALKDKSTQDKILSQAIAQSEQVFKKV